MSTESGMPVTEPPPVQSAASIEFLGTIPTSRAAWSISGDAPPNATLKLEIPASQIRNALRLITEGHEKVLRFRVTIED